MCKPAGRNGEINTLPHFPLTLPTMGWTHPWLNCIRNQRTKMTINTNGRDQPVRAQSQADKGRERMWRSQQEMSSLLAVSLLLQNSILQLRQSKLSSSLLGDQEGARWARRCHPQHICKAMASSRASDLCSYTRPHAQQGTTLSPTLCWPCLKILNNFLTRVPHFHFTLGLTDFVASLVQGKSFSLTGGTKFCKYHSIPVFQVIPDEYSLFKANGSRVNLNQSDNDTAECITW